MNSIIDVDALRFSMTSQEMKAFEAALMENFLEVCDEATRQRQAIAQHNATRPYWAVDDIGEKTAQIAKADFMIEASRGHDWSDDDFFKWWIRQDGNEYAKVHSHGTRVQSGYGGLTIIDRPRNCRYRKVYGSCS